MKKAWRDIETIDQIRGILLPNILEEVKEANLLHLFAILIKF